MGGNMLVVVARFLTQGLSRAVRWVFGIRTLQLSHCNIIGQMGNIPRPWL